MDLTKFTLIETLKALKEKQFSKKELAAAYLTRIKDLNPKLNAFLEVEQGFEGIPVAVKDLICTKGIKTTAGSKILENFVPPYDATAVWKLISNPLGFSISGKTNCDEFAMGSSGENSAFGSTLNPWDLAKVPGGSSSGSAAAIAADMSVFALATDTGGSIRQPASFCSVTGFKPSYGTISRYGLISMSSSLDQIGVLTKTVEDAKLAVELISGEDGQDSNAFNHDFAISHTLNSLKGVRVGVPEEYFGKGLDKGVETIIRKAIKKMEELGVQVVEVSLPHTQYAVAAYYIIVFSEVSSNMGRFDGIRFGGSRDLFGEEVKRRIMLGTFTLSAGYYDDYFIKAAKIRTLIKQDFQKAFEKCDVIVGPVCPTPAWNIKEMVSDPLAMYLSDIYTVPASLAGLPGLSVPAGFADGLPVGLQILGPYKGDGEVLNVGDVYQKATKWHMEKPKL